MSHTMRSGKQKTLTAKQTVVINLNVTIKASGDAFGRRARKGSTVQAILKIAGGKPFTKHLSGGNDGWTGTLPDPEFCNAETRAAIAEALRESLVENMTRKAHKGGDKIVFLCRYQLS